MEIDNKNGQETVPRMSPFAGPCYRPELVRKALGGDPLSVLEKLSFKVPEDIDRGELIYALLKDQKEDPLGWCNCNVIVRGNDVLLNGRELKFKGKLQKSLCILYLRHPEKGFSDDELRSKFRDEWKEIYSGMDVDDPAKINPICSEKTEKQDPLSRRSTISNYRKEIREAFDDLSVKFVREPKTKRYHLTIPPENISFED